MRKREDSTWVIHGDYYFPDISCDSRQKAIDTAQELTEKLSKRYQMSEMLRSFDVETTNWCEARNQEYKSKQAVNYS